MAESANLYAHIEPEIKEQAEHPLDISRMTGQQLDTELEKGYAQMKTGQTIPAKQAFDELQEL